MNSLFSSTKKQALSAILDTLTKGIDLLSNDNLDGKLYDAFEKYVISTVKMVDVAYMTNYELRFIEKDYFNPFYNSLSSYFSQPQYHIPNYAYPFRENEELIKYKGKLKVLLQKITTVVKELTME